MEGRKPGNEERRERKEGKERTNEGKMKSAKGVETEGETQSMSFLWSITNARFGLSVNPPANALIPGQGRSNNKVTLRNFAVACFTTMAPAPLPLDTTALDTNIAVTHQLLPSPQHALDAKAITITIIWCWNTLRFGMPFSASATAWVPNQERSNSQF
jgi:hypothetical protein